MGMLLTLASGEDFPLPLEAVGSNNHGKYSYGEDIELLCPLTLAAHVRVSTLTGG